MNEDTENVFEKEKRVKTIGKYQVSISGEDHTLLNVLRYAINKKCDYIELCGYTIPHPSEDVAIFRVQFVDSTMQSPENVCNAMTEGLSCVEEIGGRLLSEIETW